jgi:predicted amidohydrolase
MTATPDRYLSVGLIQSAPTFGDTAGNLARMSELISDMGPVDLAVTPELSVQGYAYGPRDWQTFDRADPRLHRWPAHARAVAIGFAEHNPGGRPFNAHAVIGPDETHVQHKLHPVAYEPWNEHLAFAPGARLETYTCRGVVCATVICNDMWHPIVPWAAAQAGAEVLIVPVASASSPAVQRTWEVAIEHAARMFECYVVFVNRCGLDGGASFWGGSRVVGPDGTVQTDLTAAEGTVTTTLDLAAVRTGRARRPFHSELNHAYLDALLAVNRRHKIGQSCV